jgi:hypothetical protein
MLAYTLPRSRTAESPLIPAGLPRLTDLHFSVLAAQSRHPFAPAGSFFGSTTTLRRRSDFLFGAQWECALTMWFWNRLA